MNDRPILFNGPMVRAILAGTKTQTRRPLKILNPGQVDLSGAVPETRHSYPFLRLPNGHEFGGPIRCPFGSPGDRLWVRETWNTFAPWNGVFYRAEDHSFGIGDSDDTDHIPQENIRWRSSIHMPRWACRLVLEVVSVHVERLQEISEADCRAEGVAEVDGHFDNAAICAMAKRIGCSHEDAKAIFACLWDSIYSAKGLVWERNPWVWAVEFKRVQP